MTVRDRCDSGIALTFDDGPCADWTPRVLEELASCGAPATFFVDISRAVTYPGLVERMLREGHQVGLHCVRHVRHADRGVQGVTEEAEMGVATLRSIGAEPTVWRTPWGEVTESTIAIARQHGLELWGWSEDTHDWRGDGRETILGAIGPSLTEGSVVLMHDGVGPGADRDHCGETVGLIGPLVALARDRGLEPRTLAACSRAEPAGAAL